jgi:hypothetical protein
MIVTLDPAEAMRAATIGVARHLRCRRDGIGNADGRPYELKDWGANVEGAGAEMAFAKWAGAYYSPPQHIDDGIDVAGCQVKQSAFAGSHLILPVKARLDVPVVLVTGMMPEYVIRGWMQPDQVDEKWLRPGSNGRAEAYWVPAGALYLLDDLKAWIREQAAA